MTPRQYFRVFRRFIDTYGFWIVLLAVTNIGAWAGLECLWRRWHLSRTMQWTATLNYRTPDEQGRHGQVEHANATPPVPPPRGENQTLVQFLDNNSRSLFEQLDHVKAQEDLALEKLREYARRKHGAN